MPRQLSRRLHISLSLRPRSISSINSGGMFSTLVIVMSLLCSYKKDGVMIRVRVIV
ncbi:hypothetical protein BDQ12DRAFT_688227 [Crucibulum laeve]|uniref:Uncharacterized protein n=1 Tax=Crucibulum laeve TaxID=68775 RepID=A0A5C3LU43_9AGAR|nr:hypothetical protein BDQ12DRAFT_688227 [Crucibulum laeve]